MDIKCPKDKTVLARVAGKNMMTVVDKGVNVIGNDYSVTIICPTDQEVVTLECQNGQLQLDKFKEIQDEPST